MEKQVFKFGTSSLAIVVPKDWAVKRGIKRGIKRGDKLFLTENSMGDIVIGTEVDGAREKTIKIDGTFNAKVLGELIVRFYMYGITIIKIHSSDKIKPDQLAEIEREIKSECSGFEIISQSEKDLVIKDFANQKGISIVKITERMIYLLSKQIDALESGDKKTVLHINETIDQLYLRGFRSVNVIQPNRLTERLDLVKRLATLSGNIRLLMHNNKKVDKELKSIKQLFSYSTQVYNGDLKTITKLIELRDDLLKSVKRKEREALQKDLIEETSDLILSISEFGLLWHE